MHHIVDSRLTFRARKKKKRENRKKRNQGHWEPINVKTWTEKMLANSEEKK